MFHKILLPSFGNVYEIRWNHFGTQKKNKGYFFGLDYAYPFGKYTTKLLNPEQYKLNVSQRSNRVPNNTEYQ